MSGSQEPQNQSTKGPGLFGRILLLVFVASLVAGQGAVAWLLIPRPEEIRAHAEAKVKKELEQEKQEKEAQQEVKTAEVDLGQYSVTIHQPESHTTFRVDFQLVGTVKESDKEELESLLQSCQNRLRFLVLVEIRNATLEELTDPGLVLIKRRILEKTNALLGKPFLQSVVFSQYSFVEQ